MDSENQGLTFYWPINKDIKREEEYIDRLYQGVNYDGELILLLNNQKE